MAELLTTEGIVSLLTLTFLEIVLGIDNIIFISITSDRLPEKDQKKARTLGILLALFVRVGLLMTISWIIGLKDPFITFGEFELSFRDLILILGGLFLLGKSSSEIHAKLEGENEEHSFSKKLTLNSAIIQIVLLDVVFSFDSILTAVGLVDSIVIMVIAIVIALGVMLAFANNISAFINKHPAMKLLAISFLMMIGLVLVVEGFHVHVPKGYIYFSMAFALGVEFLNMKIRKRQQPVALKNPTMRENIKISADDRDPVKRKHRNN
ncbi:TerC family protein [Chryseosolibacter indicus]|uniref:TerC family protein n=1 Tax=Chryseosolibacter indicus TaxID=2782351 RepID=A0ABS5VK10_9BACT|nr:TerC family protein [Chryseosolibacter indicus]MBT1701770.1 TerC family protein [Chryseosolibacter indicus]